VSLLIFRRAAVALGRGRARCVDLIAWLNGRYGPVRHVGWRRAMSHLVGDAMQLRELCDRFRNRRRIDEVGEAGSSFFLDAIESAGGAIALKGTDVARKAGVGEVAGGLLFRSWPS
jgi:hypothetical protein